jgi:hypothetical protein
MTLQRGFVASAHGRSWPISESSPVGRGVRFPGSTCRRGGRGRAVDGCDSLTQAANGPRRRPVFEQVLPWRSRSSATAFDPVQTSIAHRSIRRAFTDQLIGAGDMAVPIPDRFSRAAVPMSFLGRNKTSDVPVHPMCRSPTEAAHGTGPALSGPLLWSLRMTYSSDNWR